MQHGLRVLSAVQDGDADRAAKERAAMDTAATAAARITVDPEEHHQVGPVKLGDPFIEDFLADVRKQQGAAG